MPIFEIEGPDGIYEVDAPDENAAVAGFQKMFAQPSEQAPQGWTPQADADLAESIQGTSTFSDMTNTGVAKAIPFGDEIVSGLAAPFRAGREWFQGEGFDIPRAYDRNMQVEEELQRRRSDRSPIASTAGQIIGGVGASAPLAASGASFLTGAKPTLASMAGRGAAEGAVYGAAYGAGEGRGLDERAGNAFSGAGTGIATGGLVGGGTQVVGNVARRAVTPFATSPERIAASNTLAQEGVPLTAGQKTGSNWLRYRESELGGSQAADVMEDQGRAFTRAAMRRAGQDTLADPDSMAQLNHRLSQGFDDISARNTLQADQPMVADMNRAAQEYATVLPPEQKAIFTQLGDAIIERFRAGSGRMTGKDYQTQRSRLSRMAQSYRQRDPEFANAIRGLRNSLDDAMDRSINPADAGAWKELRKQWGNKKTLENAIASAGGEDAGLGIISPARLRMAASSGNRGGFARGESDFTDLARAGQATMTPLPNSGTPQRIAAHGLFSGLAAGGGAMAAGPVGLAAGLAAPFLAGRTLMSGPVQKYLSNQALSGPASQSAAALRKAIVEALTRGGAIQPAGTGQ